LATVELEVSFGATKGLPNYSSERADQRIRITHEVTGDTLPDWLNDVTSLERQLHNHIVYAVADALGMEAGMNEGGDASLIWPDREAAPPPQQLAPQAQAPAPQQAAQAPQGGAPRTPPKVSREAYAALPRYAMDFGDGMKMYVDQRSLKASGVYSAKAPDFKVDVSNGEGKWIYDPNGNLVAETQRAMTASNVPG
jgi:hypothetical protein